MFHQHALRRMSREAPDETYKNPVIPGFNPDPSIVRVKNDYFLTTSSFEYTPGAPIYHSTDLIQWKLIGHALTRKSQLDIRAPEPGGGVWACTLRYHNEWFYLTTCVWDRYRPQETAERAWPRGFYVKTQDIWNSNSWTDPVYYDQIGFDQDLYFDPTGQVYLSTTQRKVDRDPDSKLKDQGVHICSIDLESGNSTSPSVLIRESASGVAEGSHILKRGKYYYLFTAEGGTESGHSEYCFRSEESVFGPWEACPHNPILKNSTDEEVQNVGHADFVEDPLGRWWAFCLAVRPQKSATGWSPSLLGRETFIMPMSWEDDWPVLNHSQPLALTGVARGLHMYDWPHKWHDSFQSPTLQLGWYWKNTPVKPSSISLFERPNYLRIRPGPYKLSSPASPTALFRKLEHTSGVWKTRLAFFPDQSQSEAGTVAYWNYLSWASIGIRRTANGKREVSFTTTARGEKTCASLEASEAEVDLVIAVDGLTVRFGFQIVEANAPRVSADAGINWVGEVASESLTEAPLIGNPFTGLMLGLYAYAEQGGSAFADFAFAEFL